MGRLKVFARRMQDHVRSAHERAVVGHAELVPIAKSPSKSSRRHGAGGGATHRLDFDDLRAEIGQETTAKFAHLDRAIEHPKPFQRLAPRYVGAEAHVPVNFGGRFSTNALRPS